MSRVSDLGLQAERTALAWQRTALAMAVIAVGATRLTAPVLGVVAVVVGAVGLVPAVVLSVTSRLRYRAAHRSLLAGRSPRSARRPGLPIAATAVGTAAIAVLSVMFVLGARD